VTEAAYLQKNSNQEGLKKKKTNDSSANRCLRHGWIKKKMLLSKKPSKGREKVVKKSRGRRFPEEASCKKTKFKKAASLWFARDLFGPQDGERESQLSTEGSRKNTMLRKGWVVPGFRPTA